MQINLLKFVLFCFFQVLYMELPTATVGSLSYAEDENRHFLGLKAAIVSKDGRSQFCCYILECDSEVSTG